MEKHICTFFQRTGGNGAQYLLMIPGQEPQRVHKPCGDKAVAFAPKGTIAKVVMSDELAEERDRARAAQFWGRANGLTPEEQRRRLAVVKPAA